MEKKHKNLRDVGLALRSLPTVARPSAKTAASTLPCGRLLRCGAIDGCTFDELRRPGTIVNLRMHGEDHVDKSLIEKSVLFVHVPADNSLEKYDTTNSEVKTWLVEVLRVFERDDVRFPVLFHCRSGRDRTGVVIAALLSLLGYPEASIKREFMLSEDSEEDRISQSIAGFRKAGGAAAFFSDIDVKKVTSLILGSSSAAATNASRDSPKTSPPSDEATWLREEVQLMCKLAHAATQAKEDQEATYWHDEVVNACAVLAALVPPAEAAVALYYQGWAHMQEQRWEEAREPLTVGWELAQRGGSKPQLIKKLEKELQMLPQDVELNVVETSKASDAPGDPHSSLVVLLVDGDNQQWKSCRCPEGFSWLRCGELAASSVPQSNHLAALDSMNLSKRISAEQLGAPKPPEEHWEDVVKQIARTLDSGAGCLVYCTDGFAASGTALACFLVVYGLDDPVRADKPGQPKMTAGEAIEVLRSLRPGSIARSEDEEEVYSFAQAAWAGHVERVQRAFSSCAASAMTTSTSSSTTASGKTAAPSSSGTAAATPSRPSRPAPPGARVVRQPGDGNCLFHSMAYGLGGSNTAATLRQDICTFMEKNPDLTIAGTSLAEWIQMLAGVPVVQYARKMAKSANWGGAPEIAACANMRQVNIHVYERRGSGFELTVPFDVGGSKTVSVLYVGGVHYDALVF